MSAFVNMNFGLRSLLSRRLLTERLARITLVLICSSVPVARTLAQDAAADGVPPPEALEHYSRGRAHYQAGRYREAVAELEQALALDPDSPNLVYNLARVYELLGDIEAALAHYRRYGTMLPASEVDERARVASAIERLEGARAQATELRPPPWVVQSERGVADAAFWTLASISLAALAAGTVAGALALKSERDARSFVLGRDGDAAALDRRVARADRLGIAADVALAAGAVGTLTSVLLYALRSRTVVQPGMVITRRVAALSLEVRL